MVPRHARRRLTKPVLDGDTMHAWPNRKKVPEAHGPEPWQHQRRPFAGARRARATLWASRSLRRVGECSQSSQKPRGSTRVTMLGLVIARGWYLRSVTDSGGRL